MPFTGELRVEDSKLNDDYDDDATKQGGSLMDQKFQSGQGSLAAEFTINENNNHNNKAQSCIEGDDIDCDQIVDSLNDIAVVA